jgi:hypothetical protein
MTEPKRLEKGASEDGELRRSFTTFVCVSRPRQNARPSATSSAEAAQIGWTVGSSAPMTAPPRSVGLSDEDTNMGPFAHGEDISRASRL